MNLDLINKGCESPLSLISNFSSEKRKISMENLNEDVVKTKKQCLEIEKIAKISFDETTATLKVHLEAPLKEHGFNQETIAGLIPQLAQTIFQLNENPTKFRTRCRKMQNQGLDQNDKLNVTFNVQCTLDAVSGKIEKIHMHLYFPMEIPEARIGEGAWKKIKKSLSLTFPKGDVNAIQIIHSVIQRTVKHLPLLQIQQLLKGIERQSFLNSILDTEHQLSSTPTIQGYTSRQGFIRIELEQEWYNGDFEGMRNGIPLNRLEKSNLIFTSDAHIFDNLINLSETLQLIHQEGIVHGDVKNGNILLKINERLEAKSYLSDVDHTDYLGRIQIEYLCSFYLYWDKASINHYKLPSCDIHGLVCTIAKEFFPLNIAAMKREWFTLLAYDESFQGQLLNKIACFSLKDQLESSHLCVLFDKPTSLTRTEVLNVIKTEFYKASQSSIYSQTTKNLIKEIEKDLIIIEKIIIMLTNQFRLSDLLWDKLKSNTKLLQIFDTGSTDAKLLAYAELTSSIPGYLTAEDIGKSLKELKALRSS